MYVDINICMYVYFRTDVVKDLLEHYNSQLPPNFDTGTCCLSALSLWTLNYFRSTGVLQPVGFYQ